MKAIKLMVLGIFGVSLILVSVASAADWSVPGNFATIQAAIDNPDVLSGDRIFVAPGNHAGAFVTKGVEIKGEGGATITSGPVHASGLIMGFRLLAGSNGATIGHLTFQVDLAIMNGGAVNDVTITHCTFLNTIQAVSNWRGSSWNITHNEIIDLRTRNGGGIGILIGDYTGGVVTDNVVAHNKISGVLTSLPGEKCGYNGSGIVIYADFRSGSAGATNISYNRVVKNKIALASLSTQICEGIPNTTLGVDVVAFEMTDTRDDPLADPFPVIEHNAVGFNDFRGTTLQIILTPDNLDEYNDISRNLGDNRGHGLHPSLFLPD